MTPPMNGTEQRLQQILEELQALRQLLTKPEPDLAMPITLKEPQHERNVQPRQRRRS
jgi:hypothetical protein